ncbi:MAG: 8-amino-7-oxononanoate synthase [Crocinitomicaceae bacterium]
MDKKLHKKITDREEKGTLRSLSLSAGMVDFGSNDYLGLAKLANVQTSEESSGATGSRLITGNSEQIEAAEERLALFFDSKAAICFNSGYDANIGILSAVPQRGDIIIYDEFIHASARDGIRLSHAKSYSFNHNSVEDLRRLLEKNTSSTCYIAIEALYSMDGDFCPLLDICQLAEQFGAYVILDEAHSAGIYGEDGKGLAHALILHENLLIRLVTFGKAYGAHGAVVLCSTDMQTFLINFARSLIYTTALPVSCYIQMATIVSHPGLKARRDQLQENIAYFRANLSTLTSRSAANSPIQIVEIKAIQQLREVEQDLRKANLFVKAIYAPTVAEGRECLRICIHSENSLEELDQLHRLLDEWEA